jgi:hypothetical protein
MKTTTQRNCTRGKRKGHGRISACAYQGAQHVGVPHQHLRPGDTCPGCTRGRVYRLPEPARIMRIVGQPPLAAKALWNNYLDKLGWVA